jgi:hypothetical protein
LFKTPIVRNGGKATSVIHLTNEEVGSTTRKDEVTHNDDKASKAGSNLSCDCGVMVGVRFMAPIRKNYDQQYPNQYRGERCVFSD